jgi:hypothetical protein
MVKNDFVIIVCFFFQKNEIQCSCFLLQNFFLSKENKCFFFNSNILRIMISARAISIFVLATIAICFTIFVEARIAVDVSHGDTLPLFASFRIGTSVKTHRRPMARKYHPIVGVHRVITVPNFHSLATEDAKLALDAALTNAKNLEQIKITVKKTHSQTLLLTRTIVKLLKKCWSTVKVCMMLVMSQLCFMSGEWALALPGLV